MTVLNWFTVVFATAGFLITLVFAVLLAWSLVISRQHAANAKQISRERRERLHADAVSRAYEETMAHDLLELWFELPSREPRA